MVIMSASSTLVNVAEDVELRLIRLLADTSGGRVNSNFVNKCESCIVNRNAAALIKTVINDVGAISALFVLEPVDESISAFSLLAALLNRVNNDNERKQLTHQFADAITNISSLEGKTQSQLVERQIALLSVLYNMRPDTQDKNLLLTRMIRLAGAYSPQLLEAGQPLGQLLHEDESTAANGNNNAAALLSPPTPRLVSLLDAWGISKPERRDLYRAVADGLQVDDTSCNRKQRFLLLLVESYSTAQEVNNDAIIAAKEAALGAIKDPVSLFVHQRNILSLPAIQALKSNNATVGLYKLLQVFQEGKLDDYHNYLKSNGGETVLQSSLGLDHNECIKNMRILSLCSLAAEHEEIPYHVVQETLLLDSNNVDDNVESWVIAAVSSNLLSAKMDQLTKKVMVERCVVRKFDLQQWKLLQWKLNIWKKNISNVITGLKQSHNITNTAVVQE